ncbi:hypothetical protein, partial [Escherichia coli]|uniref:hypothetical protein n=1 Tax=Escherichia coli TaxID=562 RepID=UPI0024AFC84E
MVAFQVAVAGPDVIHVLGHQGVAGGMDQGVEEQQALAGVEQLVAQHLAGKEGNALVGPAVLRE